MGIRIVRVLAVPLLLASAMAGSSSQAQDARHGIIIGHVSDGNSKEPLDGALITVEGTELAVLTGNDGAYRIVRVPSGARTITVRRIGHAAGRSVVTVPDDGTVTADFVLQPSAANLQEVVVTGTAGDQTRAANGAVVASINTADLTTKAPVTDVTEVLQGRIAGVDVANASGTVGASARINIRGSASIDLSNSPLIFIDGVRVDNGQRNDLGNFHGLEQLGGQSVSPLDDLPPDDIESIEVVKGPAAATLYGADASAGVIQIITKHGKGSHGFSQSVTGEYDAVSKNFTPYSNYSTCSAGEVGAGGPFLCQGLSAGAVVHNNPLIQDDIYQTGTLGSLAYSGQGGTDNFGYYVSANGSNESGTVPNNFYMRRSARAAMHWVITPRLSVDVSATLLRNDYRLPQGDDSQYGPLTDAGFEGSPLLVGKGPNGKLTDGLAIPIDAGLNIENRLITNRTTPTVQVQYSPVEWFTNRVIVGADLSSTHATNFYPKNSLGWYTGDQANGYVEDVQNPINTYTFDYLGNIKLKFGHNNLIASNTSFGAQYIDIVDNALTGVGIGIASNSSNLVSSAASSESHQTFGETKSLGFLAQEELGFGDVFFVQGGFRVDQNSSFGSAYGAFFLPKVNASFVVSQLPFWQSIASTFSTLRIRAAYGTTGRSPTPGASLATYTATSVVLPDGSVAPGVVQASPGNQNLKPERGTEFEGGIDAGFFKDRLALELTYFDKHTNNLLLQQPLAPSLAYTVNPFVNVGEVDNRGLEVTIRATPVQTRNFSWDATVTGNTLRNDLLSLGGVNIANSSVLYPDLTQRYTVGHPLASIWSSKIVGVKNAGTDSAYAVITDSPQFIGPQFPTFQGNVSTTLTFFRVLRLYGLLNTQSGGQILNLTQILRDLVSISPQVNLPAGKGGYSQAELVRRFGPYRTQSGDPGGPVLTDYIQSTDYTRIGEVSASLTLPSEIARRLHGTGATLTFGVRNLALWHNKDYQGWDPGVIFNTAGTQFTTADEFSLPQPRRFFTRLNLQF